MRLVGGVLALCTLLLVSACMPAPPALPDPTLSTAPAPAPDPIEPPTNPDELAALVAQRPGVREVTWTPASASPDGLALFDIAVYDAIDRRTLEEILEFVFEQIDAGDIPQIVNVDMVVSAPSAPDGTVAEFSSITPDADELTEALDAWEVGESLGFGPPLIDLEQTYLTIAAATVDFPVLLDAMTDGGPLDHVAPRVTVSLATYGSELRCMQISATVAFEDALIEGLSVLSEDGLDGEPVCILGTVDHESFTIFGVYPVDSHVANEAWQVEIVDYLTSLGATVVASP